MIRNPLGRIQIPPLPVILALTDRADGTVWYLTHDTANGGYIGITDTAPASTKLRLQVQRYAANEGPYVATRQPVRFLVRGGRIGYEPAVAGDITSYGSSRVYTRLLLSSTSYEIVAAGWIEPGDTLGYIVP